MNWKEYEKLAMRTVNKELSKDERLANAIMGLNGEIGEVTDIVKKYLYQGHKLEIAAIEEELGDVIWYMALLTNVLDLDIDKIQKDNIEKLEKRYKKGFTAEESINRKE